MTDIVSAIADCFAAVGTVGAFWVTLHLLTVELATRRSAQASLVSAWLPGAAAAWRTNPRLRVSNLSDQPVYDLKVFVSTESGTHEIFDAALVPSRRGNTNPFFEITCDGLPEPATVIGHVVTEFTDAAGVRWRRERDGRLNRHRRDRRCVIRAYASGPR